MILKLFLESLKYEKVYFVTLMPFSITYHMLLPHVSNINHVIFIYFHYWLYPRHVHIYIDISFRCSLQADVKELQVWTYFINDARCNIFILSLSLWNRVINLTLSCFEICICSKRKWDEFFRSIDKFGVIFSIIYE